MGFARGHWLNTWTNHSFWKLSPMKGHWKRSMTIVNPFDVSDWTSILDFPMIYTRTRWCDQSQTIDTVPSLLAWATNYFLAKLIGHIYTQHREHWTVWFELWKFKLPYLIGHIRKIFLINIQSQGSRYLSPNVCGRWHKWNISVQKTKIHCLDQSTIVECR